MKIFIAFMFLFFTNCLAPTAVSATVNVKTAVVYSVVSFDKPLIFKPVTKEFRPKWVKVLEWAIPIFLIVGIILFISCFNLSLWAPMIVRPLNYNLALVSFAISALSALTLFFYRIPKIVRELK
jgi:hypothetical protein